MNFTIDISKSQSGRVAILLGVRTVPQYGILFSHWSVYNSQVRCQSVLRYFSETTAGLVDTYNHDNQIWLTSGKHSYITNLMDQYYLSLAYFESRSDGKFKALDL